MVLCHSGLRVLLAARQPLLIKSLLVMMLLAWLKGTISVCNTQNAFNMPPNFMSIWRHIVFIGLVTLCGCSTGKQYVRGNGDVGEFILQKAIMFGGHPIATNGLPRIQGRWKYIQDEYGVGILLSPWQDQPVNDFVHAAFGPRSNSAGWSARDFGVAIMVSKTDSNLSVGIYPSMSYKRMGHALGEMPQDVDKTKK